MARLRSNPIQTDLRLQMSPVRGRGHETMGLQIIDERSGLTVLEAELTPQQFFNLMAQAGATTCFAELYNAAEEIGKYAERKSVTFPVRPNDVYDPTSAARPGWLRGEVAKLVTDGWRADNPTRNNRSEWVVRLTRFHDRPIRETTT